MGVVPGALLHRALALGVGAGGLAPAALLLPPCARALLPLILHLVVQPRSLAQHVVVQPRSSGLIGVVLVVTAWYLPPPARVAANAPGLGLLDVSIPQV